MTQNIVSANHPRTLQKHEEEVVFMEQEGKLFEKKSVKSALQTPSLNLGVSGSSPMILHSFDQNDESEL